MGKFRVYHQKIQLGIQECEQAGITGIETHCYAQPGNVNSLLTIVNLGDRYNLVRNNQVLTNVDSSGFARLPLTWKAFEGRYQPLCGLTPGGFLQACLSLVAMSEQAKTPVNAESIQPVNVNADTNAKGKGKGKGGKRSNKGIAAIAELDVKLAESDSQLDTIKAIA